MKSKEEQIDSLAKKFNWDDLKKKRMLALVPDLTMTLSMSAEEAHELVYRDENLKVQLNIITPKKDGHFQKEERYYRIDGNETEYKTPLELMEAMYEKGLNPLTQPQA